MTTAPDGARLPNWLAASSATAPIHSNVHQPTTRIQLDLFTAQSDPPRQLAAAPADCLLGLTVCLADACQCGSQISVIGEGKGPHRASLFCGLCDRHRGWMANEAHAFVSSVVTEFGKPTTPIKVRRKTSEGEHQ
jgi:hypothetical protein